jgi:hypothetical protein
MNYFAVEFGISCENYIGNSSNNNPSNLYFQNMLQLFFFGLDSTAVNNFLKI